MCSIRSGGGVDCHGVMITSLFRPAINTGRWQITHEQPILMQPRLHFDTAGKARHRLHGERLVDNSSTSSYIAQSQPSLKHLGRSACLHLYLYRQPLFSISKRSKVHCCSLVVVVMLVLSYAGGMPAEKDQANLKHSLQRYLRRPNNRRLITLTHPSKAASEGNLEWASCFP